MGDSGTNRSLHPFLRDGAGSRGTRVFAHRGLVTDAMRQDGIAENTRAAISAAVSCGATFVETDVRATSDGVAVLMHDADLARVAGNPQQVRDVPFHELRAMFADRGGLLSLPETLDLFPDTRFNVDVKSSDAISATALTLAPHTERVLLTSFSDSRRIRTLHRIARVPGTLRPATSPGRNALIRLLAALRTGSEALVNRALRGIDALQIPETHGRIRILTPALLNAAHRAGVEVHVWTVNDAVRMRELAALGVDGIVTDRADTALQTLRGETTPARLPGGGDRTT